MGVCMRAVVLLVSVILAPLTVPGESPADTRTFMLLAPKRIQAPSMTQVCLLVMGELGAGTDIKLNLWTGLDLVASLQEQLIGETMCMELEVSGVPEGREVWEGALEVEVGGEKKATAKVRLQACRPVMFLQTDRGVYRDGDWVQLRILSIDQEMKPILHDIPEVWLEDPTGLRVVQWRSVAPDSGLAQLQFRLPQDSGGWWQAFAHPPPCKNSNSSTIPVTAKFLVQSKYQLPRFQLVLEAPSAVSMAAQSSLTWRVCASYMHGMPVRGHVEAQVTSSTPLTSMQEVVLGVNGCAWIWSLLPPHMPAVVRQLNLTATVRDSVSKETGWITVQLASYPLQVSVLPKGEHVFRPGVPLNGAFKAMNLNGKAAANITLQICTRTLPESNVACRNETTDEDGIAYFSIVSAMPESDGIETSRLHVWAHAVDNPHDTLDAADAWLSARPAFSPSGASIQINIPMEQKYIPCKARVQVSIYLRAFPDSNNIPAVTAWILVESKGHLHAEKIRMDQAVLAAIPKNTIILGEASDMMPLWHIEVPIDRPKATSRFRVMALALTQDALMSDVATMEVQCGGVATVKWANKEKLRPGDEVKFHIEAAPDSLCGLAVVDSAVRVLKKIVLGNDGEINLWKGLERFSVQPDEAPKQKRRCQPFLAEFPTVPTLPPFKDNSAESSDIDLRRRRRSLFFPSSDYADITDSFDEFGVSVATDAAVPIAPCRIPPRLLPLFTSGGKKADAFDDQPKVVRTFFPDTWLWELIPIDQTGKTSLVRQLPDSLTQWEASVVCSGSSGVLLSQRSTALVTKQLFLDVQLPKRAVRGETVPVRVVVFNKQDEADIVQVSLATDPVQVLNESDIRTMQIGPYVPTTMVFKVTLTNLGMTSVTVSITGATKSDTVVKTIEVQPEGFRVERSRGALLCVTGFKSPSRVTVTATIPPNAVPDSLVAELWTSGDVMAATLRNPEELVSLPLGCGEQNMLRLAPNVMMLRYLRITKQNNTGLEPMLISHIVTGLQRQITFRGNDGSFSPFGDEGSIWLTAFTMQVMAQVEGEINARGMYVPELQVTREVIRGAAKWLKGRQMENGCFRPSGFILHRGLRGRFVGNNSLGDEEESEEDNPHVMATLTSYVLASLAEAGSSVPDLNVAEAIHNAVFCLVGAAPPEDDYALTLRAYALSLAPESNARQGASELARRLLKQAIRRRGLVWWSPHIGSKEMAVETTGYAALTLMQMIKRWDRKQNEKGFQAVSGAVRWLLRQRNSRGGFTSTQDTVVGLQALSGWAERVGVGEIDLEVEAKMQDGRVFKVQVSPSERLLVKSISLPPPPFKMGLRVRGKGCVVVSVSWWYSTHTSTTALGFDLGVLPKELPSVENDCKSMLKTCMRYTGDDSQSNMALLQVQAPTGWHIDGQSLQAAQTGRVQRTELDGEVATLYLKSVESETYCLELEMQRLQEVGGSKPAKITLVDYYEGSNSAVAEYTLGDCRWAGWTVVEHELEFPDGDESQEETLLQTTPGVPSGKGRGSRRIQDECPLCLERPPSFLPELLCNANSVMFGRLMLNSTVELRSVTGGESNLVTLELPFGCACSVLGGLGLLVDPPESHDGAPLFLGDGTTLVGVVSRGRGVPAVARQALRSCSQR